MSNVTVQKTEAKNAPLQTREWDPARVQRDLLRWDPFAELLPMQSGEAARFAPAFEIKEQKDGFVFKADVPGVKETDLDVKLSKNRLSVTGKRESEKTEKTDTFYTHERSYGSFTRTFTLPEGVDAERIKAELKEGVLTIELPKRPDEQPKKVAVKTG